MKVPSEDRLAGEKASQAAVGGEGERHRDSGAQPAHGCGLVWFSYLHSLSARHGNLCIQKRLFKQSMVTAAVQRCPKMMHVHQGGTPCSVAQNRTENSALGTDFQGEDAENFLKLEQKPA